MFVKCNYYTVKISYSCFYSIWGTSSSSKTNTYENLISPSQDSANVSNSEVYRAWSGAREPIQRLHKQSLQDPILQTPDFISP